VPEQRCSVLGNQRPGCAGDAVAKDAKTNSYPPWRWEESDDAVKAYGALFGMMMLGQLPAAQQSQVFDIFYFLTLALMTIYIGAHRGLTTSQRQQLTMKEVQWPPSPAQVDPKPRTPPSTL
jgi:hypothetical protein